jgi:hypothetical protein
MRDTVAELSPTIGDAAPDRSRLFDVVTGQGGYFTAEQARACGYSWALLSHHVKSGRYIRIRRGLKLDVHFRHCTPPSASVIVDLRFFRPDAALNASMAQCSSIRQL